MVVESPAKVKALAEYLGGTFEIRSTGGPVCNDAGILRGKTQVINELRKASQGKEAVYLAFDVDNETIAWHVAEKLGVPREKLRRVLFQALTRDAVEEALAQPQELSLARYEAQRLLPADDLPTIYRTCPSCERPMQIRVGRRGRFFACTGYPDCRNAQPIRLPEPIGVRCPDCKKGDLVGKFSRLGKPFFGCNRYPTCSFASWRRPIAEPCLKCDGKYLVEAVTRQTGVEKRCPSPECDFRC